MTTTAGNQSTAGPQQPKGYILLLLILLISRAGWAQKIPFAKPDHNYAAFRGHIVAQAKNRQGALKQMDRSGYRDLQPSVQHQLGKIRAAQGQVGQAESASRQAVGLWEKLAIQFSDVPHYRIALGIYPGEAGGPAG